MDHARHIDQLARHRRVFQALLEGLDETEVRFRPAPGKWCLLEIVCHLYDEERDDFRARLTHVFETPEAPLPPTDPPGWVTSRRYMEQDFGSMLERFLAERDRTVEWLRGYSGAPWSNAHPHPRVGPITGELFLVNWVAHDLHHIRQINNLKHAQLAAASSEPLDYAGEW